MEERRAITKLLYKVELIILKFIPMVLALMYFFNTILPYFNIDARVLNYLGGLSLIPMIFLIDTGVLGDVEIGNGQIKLKVPMIDKTISLTMQDINKFRQMLTM